MRSHATAPARLSARGALGSSGQLSKTRAATRNARRAVTRAAGAPAASAEKRTATNALTKKDLVAYLESGCKPKSQWRRVAPLRAPVALAFRDLLILAAAKSARYDVDTRRPF